MNNRVLNTSLINVKGALLDRLAEYLLDLALGFFEAVQVAQDRVVFVGDGETKLGPFFLMFITTLRLFINLISVSTGRHRAQLARFLYLRFHEDWLYQLGRPPVHRR